MIRISNIKIDVLSDNENTIINKLEKELKEKVLDYKIVKKSIDARKDVKYVYTFDVSINNEEKVLKRNKNINKTPREEYKLEIKGSLPVAHRPIIVGTGPSGLFLGYMLSKYGYKPLLIERGEKIEDRVKTVEKFWGDNNLNAESNVQFGEGGAGTFSDGKLNTLVKDKCFRMKKVFEILGYSEETIKTKFGALYEAFQYGAPPHAGIAPGIDRIIMLLTGEECIRDIIAFPMNSKAQDLLMGAPGEVSEEQLKDVHITIEKKY